jgi:hypothetical protein
MSSHTTPYYYRDISISMSRHRHRHHFALAIAVTIRNIYANRGVGLQHQRASSGGRCAAIG